LVALIKRLDKVDEEKAKEDARKVGVTLFAAAIIGVGTSNLNVYESILVAVISISLWYYGVY
jgi:hypothetical protein